MSRKKKSRKPPAQLARLDGKREHEIFSGNPGGNGFDAAVFTKRLKNVRRAVYSPQDLTKATLDVLVARHQDLVRNNPTAKQAERLTVDGMLGTGLDVDVTGPKSMAKRAQKLWDDWSENPEECDAEGRRTFKQMQLLCGRGLFCGEFVILIIPSPENKTIPIRLKCIEGLQIDLTKNEENENSTIVQGVEYNAHSRRIAYHILKKPRSMSVIFGDETTRIPAEFVIHGFKEDRPGQVRGIPDLTPVMLNISDLREETESRLLLGKLACFFSGFIRSPETEHRGVTGDIEEDSPATGKTTREIEMIPGALTDLGPDEEIVFSNPPNVDGSKEFTTSIKREIASGLGLSYENLYMDYSKVNFISGRLGNINQARFHTRQRREVFFPAIQQIFKAAMKAAGPFSGIDPTRIKAAISEPKPISADPSKDVANTRDRVRTGVISLEQAIREDGGNFDDIMESHKKVNETLDAYGLVFDSDPRKITKAGISQVEPIEDKEGMNEVKKEGQDE